MKNLITKTLLLLLVLFVGISLTSCTEEKTDTYNKNVSYGNLSDTTVYAKIGDSLTLSEKQLYNELRVNGYDYLFEEMIKTIVNPSTYNFTIEENEAELIKLIAWLSPSAIAIRAAF